MCEEKKRLMYVVVRNDLSDSYKMVQGAHALAQFALDHPRKFRRWNNGFLIFLAVPNLISLRNLWEELPICTAFVEPDLDMQETALVYYAGGNTVPERITQLPLA